MSRDNCWFNSSCCSVIICTGVVSEICVTACMLLLLWKPVYYFLAIFLSSSSFFFFTIVNFQNMIFNTTNCKCHSPPNHTMKRNRGTKTVVAAVQSKKKKKRKKKRKKVGFQSIICLWLKVKKKKKNWKFSWGNKKNSLCKAPFTKQMQLCIIFFLLFSLPPRSKALSTCKQSQATARNQSQH